MSSRTPTNLAASVRKLASIPLVRSSLLAALLLLALWLIAPQALDLPRVLGQIQAAALPWLLASLAAQVARYLGTGLLMALSARAAGRHISARAASEASLASGAAARLLPLGGAGGIAVRAAFLKRQGVGEAAIAGYFVLQNLLGTAWLIVILLPAAGIVGTGIAPGGATMAEFVPLAAAALAAGALIALLARRPELAHWIATATGRAADAILGSRRPNPPLQARLPLLLEEALSALNIGAQIRCGLWVAAFYSSWTILGDTLSLHFSVLALGLPVSLSQTVVAYGAASLAGSAVGLPAGVGVTEGTMVAAYVAMTQPLEQSLSAVLLFRALSFWLPIPLGLLAGWHLRRRRAL
ncbi:MAG: flippase-like domain-containing protein [Anaerolineae bacterium]|nr:flippase-like domain-containing protein [Anaerolineae bacterium]